jgi:hypothetical protein
LQASLTGGNRNDVTQLMPLIQDIPPVRGRRGRPRRRPDTVYADRAYDHDKYRKQVRAVGVTPVIARRGTGTRLRAGPVPLGRRADVCPVALVPATAHPLGDPRRHPRGIPSPGVRHHLPPPVDQPGSEQLAELTEVAFEASRCYDLDDPAGNCPGVPHGVHLAAWLGDVAARPQHHFSVVGPEADLALDHDRVLVLPRVPVAR